jgi:hypothetical protein
MEKQKKEKMSKRRRAFLIAVGYMSLALDKLEGKSTQPPQPVKRGRIKIVS